MLLLSRPYLEARRPLASLALLLGMALGPSTGGLIPAAVLAELQPLMALAGGWLALLAAESFSLGTLRRARAGRRLLLVAIIALIAAGLAILWPAARMAGQGQPVAWLLLGPTLLLACAAAALDPDAAREALSATERPDAVARLAPSAASLALGFALAGAAVASGFHHGASTTVDSHPAWAALSHMLLTLLLGAGLGLTFVGPLRLAEGRGPLLALLLSMPLLGWGVAAWLGMSPLAALLAAGVVLANDSSRRDLLFTLMRELERPLLVALLLLAGASIPFSSAIHGSATFWLMTGTFLLARLALWRVIPASGLSRYQSLPLSPLAIPLSLEALSWPGSDSHLMVWMLPAAVAVAFVVSEAAWMLISRARGSSRLMPRDHGRTA